MAKKRRRTKSLRRARAKVRRAAKRASPRPRPQFNAKPFAPAGGSSMARRRRRRSVGSTVRRVARRARHRAGGLAGSTSLRAVLTAGAGATAGFIATDFLIDRVPGLNGMSGYGRIAGKAALAYFGGKLLSRYSPAFGRALMTGGMVRAGVDLYNAIRAGQAAQQPLPAGRTVAGLLGIGEYADDTEYADDMMQYA